MENKKDVFYLAGYDPRSYRYYYALLKRNLYKQNYLNGLNLSISPCSQKNEIPCCVIVGEESQVNYHFCNGIVSSKNIGQKACVILCLILLIF